MTTETPAAAARHLLRQALMQADPVIQTITEDRSWWTQHAERTRIVVEALETALIRAETAELKAVNALEAMNARHTGIYLCVRCGGSY